MMQGCIGWGTIALRGLELDCQADRMPWLLACDFVRFSMRLPIRLSGIARFSGWIRSAGEALLEVSTGESYCELSGALPLESMVLQPYCRPLCCRKHTTNKGPVADKCSNNVTCHSVNALVDVDGLEDGQI